MNHHSGIQRFTGIVSRTEIRAAAALSAGVRVQQALPGELVDTLHAIGLAFSKLFPRQGLDPLQPAQIDVGNGGQDMHMLAVGKVVQKTEEDQGMNPPENFGSRIISRKDIGYQVGYRHPGSCAFNAVGDFAAMQTEEGDHEPGDQTQYDESIAAAGYNISGWKRYTANHSENDSYESQYGYDIKDEGEGKISAIRQSGKADSIRGQAVQNKFRISD